MNAGMWVGIVIAAVALLVIGVGMLSNTPGGVGTAGLGGMLEGAVLLFVAVFIFLVSWII